MTYRAVVRHVRYWRGAVHKWSTVYQFVGTPSTALDSAAAHLVLTADDKFCYGNGAANGGTYECDIYNVASGGVPIASYIAFPWATPASWIGYSGTNYTGLASPVFDPNAETALQVEWAAGLSKSGKPVRLRKWYHAVPFQAASGSGAELPAGTVTALTTAANAMVNVLGSYGVTLGSSSGRFAGAALVLPYYGNHQMPRGRRRKVSGSKVANAQQAFQVLENQVYGGIG